MTHPNGKSDGARAGGEARQGRAREGAGQDRRRGPARTGSGVALRLVIVALVVAAAFWAREVLLPLTVAGLLSMVLAPIVDRLERWGVGNVTAVGLVVGVVFSFIAVIGFAVTKQTLSLVSSLPQYRDNIRERIESVRSTGPTVIGEAAEMVDEIQREIEGKEPRDATETPEEARARRESASRREREERVDGALEQLTDAMNGDGEPIPVTVRSPAPTPIQMVENFVGPLIKPAASFGIVVVFVIFLLLNRRDLKDRFLQLAGRGHIQMTVQAIDEAGSRISRYLLAHVCLNVVYGVPVGLVLYFLGLPGAALWGLLAALLRFVPYVGPWTAAILPFVLSLAVFDGWAKPLYVAATFIVLELISNNALEPWLYGSRSGISTLAVLLAALFWGWLWGPLGIVIAVPLTVVLVVVGRYVPQLAVFNILLGDESSLAPGVRFYHRVLARDEEGALRLANAAHAEGGAGTLADRVLLTANSEEKRDRLRGTLAAERSGHYWELVEDLLANIERPEPSEGERALRSADEPHAAAREVWCVFVEPDCDELNAQLLELALAEGGRPARVMAPPELDLATGAPLAIVVLGCSPFDQAVVRRTAAHSLRHARGAPVLVHLAGEPITDQLRERFMRLGASAVVDTFEELLAVLDEQLAVPVDAEEVAGAAAVGEPAGTG